MDWKKGQSVFGMGKGSYAEKTVAEASDIYLKPDNLSDEEAATLPVGALTAWQALEDAKVSSGQTIAILGAAGGVGLIAVQLAKLKGATVIGTCSASNLDFVQSLGAMAIDYSNSSEMKQIKAVDAVLDFVGSPANEAGYHILKKGGTMVTIAGMLSEEKLTSLGINGITSGRGPGALLKAIAELIAAHKIKPFLGKVFTFTESRNAMELSQKGHGRGRIVLKMY